MLPYSNFVGKSNKTIYINPNFKRQMPIPDNAQSMQAASIPKNAHINPLFLKKTDNIRNTIHMNPDFLLKFQERQELHQEVQKEISNNDPTVSSAYLSESVHSPVNKINGGRKIIRISKNCLIREPIVKNIEEPTALKSSPSAVQPLLVLNKRKLIRKVSRPPETFKRQKDIAANDFRAKITKYKLDNRLAKRKPLLPPTPRIKRTSFVGRYALRRTSFSEASNVPAKISFNQHKNKKLAVLNINGLFYKSTRNSLKLKDVPANQVLKSYNCSSSIGKTNLSANPGLTIFVRGNKYVMDANKFKLTRVPNCDSMSPNRTNPMNRKALTCQRIDIGGYTYISTNSTKNVLIRTGTHLSRAYVHNAKQKSLQTLAKRFIKTNIPCPIFQRIGKCAAFERGKCTKVHNKLQVAICSKFLRGECHNPNCLLSHNVSLSKMPVCKFYLQGVCVRNDCPYLHKKLSNATELCTEFLRGFCKMADKCNKRHEFVCPNVERNNKCSNKSCLYCSAKNRQQSNVNLKSANETASISAQFSADSSKENIESQSSKRYFVESCEKSFQNRTGNNNERIEEDEKDINESENVEHHSEYSAEIRPKLGALPAYIPL